jgi:hypothetical protein
MVRRCSRRGERTSPYYYGCARNGVNVQQTLAILRAAVRMNIATSTCGQ